MFGFHVLDNSETAFPRRGLIIRTSYGSFRSGEALLVLGLIDPRRRPHKFDYEFITALSRMMYWCALTTAWGFDYSMEPPRRVWRWDFRRGKTAVDKPF